MRTGLVVLALLAVVTNAAALPETATYRRIGGWKYLNVEAVPSCGSKPKSEFASTFLPKVKLIAYNKTALAVSGIRAPDQLTFVDGSASAVWLIKESDVTKVLMLAIMDSETGPVLGFNRTVAFADGSRCADTWSAKLEPAR
jgi:hypothetical protein